MGEIAYQNKDVASKTLAEALKGKSLAVFGLPHVRIADILPTNLPAVESNELRLDNLFLLDDSSVALLDYESVFDKENFVKYINYIARVIKRYSIQKQLEMLTCLRMIVIYTADVECVNTCYDLGGITLMVEPAYLIHMDSSEIYKRLDRKIRNGESLTDDERMELMVLPLTVKGIPGKQEAIVAAVNLAKCLPVRDQQLQVLAGILTFSDKVIDQTYKKRIKEEMQMTQIGQMLIDEGMERGMEVGRMAGIEAGMEAGMKKIITSMLLKQKSVEEIHNDTDIPVELIQKVNKALSNAK